MASPLAHAVLFTIFVALAYLLNYYPMNKMHMSLDRLRRATEARRAAAETVPERPRHAVVFPDPATPVPTTVRARLDPYSGDVTVSWPKNRRQFKLGEDEDVRTLLPILLLSK
ncbi:conserved hypothetical pox protein [Squirrelpox virus]|uniref:Entry-fusion complex protein OPG086 n=1 Tax=Squirrelpox virus TaxID=240426 RepID=U3UBC6_9POXV|nr:conserved hypothetical pox protein [Squirrelpox virus]CCD83228.1 conserved hypothetical pox protein [Squirrelpox virus]